jgi:hypothetical protein
MVSAIVLAAAALMGGDAKAGVMLPWNSSLRSNSGLGIEESCLGSRIDPFEGRAAPTRIGSAGTASPIAAAQQSSSSESLPIPAADEHDPLRSPAPMAFERALSPTSGGASAPVNGSGGLFSGAFAMTVALSATDPLGACAYRNWREGAPRLPGLPPCELLDPPKACV